MTPLLWVLVSRPGLGCRSSTQTDAPFRAIVLAAARPVTPAPMTATSMRSMYLCVQRRSRGRSNASAPSQTLMLQWYTSRFCCRHFFGVWMTKRALITGITGQDGSYLAELLLQEGYEVFGMVRRLSSPNTWRIEHIL